MLAYAFPSSYWLMTPVCWFLRLQIDREKRLDGRGGRVARRLGKFGGFGERRRRWRQRNQQQRRRTLWRWRVLQWYGGGLRGKTRRRFIRTTVAVHSRTQRQNREMAVELPESGQFATDVAAAAATVICALWTRTTNRCPHSLLPHIGVCRLSLSKIPPWNVFQAVLKKQCFPW